MDILNQLCKDFTAESALSIEATHLSASDLTDEELQWYARELRNVCGDDVACEELSAIAVEVYL
mgnify:CR=1 FL=1